MDKVRLGRVLGQGARMAARTVVEAVDAATAPAPPGKVPAGASSGTVRRAPMPAPTAHGLAGGVARTAGQVHAASQAARQGVLAPVKRASRALTLEISGSFFGLFALSFAVAVWRTWHGNADKMRLWLYAALGVLFLYFSVSSFVRARRLTAR